MNVIEKLETARQELFKHFGYVEDWALIPVADETGWGWWFLTGDGSGGGDSVYFGQNSPLVDGDEEGKGLYSCPIYTQIHLPKWVYRADDMTMICMDTQTDGNRVLGIFDNTKEVTDPAVIEAVREYW